MQHVHAHTEYHQRHDMVHWHRAEQIRALVRHRHHHPHLLICPLLVDLHRPHSLRRHHRHLHRRPHFHHLILFRQCHRRRRRRCLPHLLPLIRCPPLHPLHCRLLIVALQVAIFRICPTLIRRLSRRTSMDYHFRTIISTRHCIISPPDSYRH